MKYQTLFDYLDNNLADIGIPKIQPMQREGAEDQEEQKEQVKSKPEQERP
jgi:FMN-dependent NADH-azoreductase